MKSLGFVFIPVLIILVLVFVIILAASKDGLIKLSFPSLKTNVATFTPSPFPSLSPSPSLAPTLTPRPIVSPTPKSSVTPRPTLKPVSGPPGSGLSIITVATDKGNFAATVLLFDMGNTKVITDTANDNDCANDCLVNNLQTYVTKNGGFAGVNGTYLCPGEPAYPACAGKANSFDFPVYNTRLSRWINGGNLSWNGRAMVYFDGSGAHYFQNANSFSGGLTAGIVNYPGLVDGGNVQIDDNQSGLDPKQQSKNSKTGIGIRGGTIMVVIAQNVTMQEFAYVFKSLGATGALNLDNGGSTALYYGGRYIFGPGRNIPNAVIFASK